MVNLKVLILHVEILCKNAAEQKPCANRTGAIKSRNRRFGFLAQQNDSSQCSVKYLNAIKKPKKRTLSQNNLFVKAVKFKPVRIRSGSTTGNHSKYLFISRLLASWGQWVWVASWKNQIAKSYHQNQSRESYFCNDIVFRSINCSTGKSIQILPYKDRLEANTTHVGGYFKIMC